MLPRFVSLPGRLTSWEDAREVREFFEGKGEKMDGMRGKVDGVVEAIEASAGWIGRSEAEMKGWLVERGFVRED